MLGEGCLMLGGAEEAIAPRVLRWLRDRARETLHHETEVYAARAGLRLGQVSVGDPRSRWGSCASNGNIRYSWRLIRSEEHTSELQSLMRISYAVFCLKKKKKNKHSTSMYQL